MDNSVIDAYVNGRLAGASHFRVAQVDSDVVPPANPCPSSEYMAAVEWDRGFNDGFAQGARAGSRLGTANDEGQKVRRRA
jgi:hypothetical protein